MSRIFLVSGSILACTYSANVFHLFGPSFLSPLLSLQPLGSMPLVSVPACSTSFHSYRLLSLSRPPRFASPVDPLF
ncbi:hypothetical protein BDV19DRAFT_369244 [Aspergillus venezuelensis]